MRPSPRRDEVSRSSSPMAVSASATTRDGGGQTDHDADARSVDDRVDGLAGEHGRGDAEHGRDRGQHEEGGRWCAGGGGRTPAIPRRVARRTRLRGRPSSCMALRSAIQVFMSLMASRLGVQVHFRSSTLSAVSHDLSIGALAERTGVAPSALRFYEAEGLIHADRTEGGQRRYGRDAIRRVSFIRVAQEVGLRLDEIREALSSLPDGRTPTRARLGPPVALVAAPPRRPDRHARAPPRPARRLHRLRLPVAAGLPHPQPRRRRRRTRPRPPLRPRRRLRSLAPPPAPPLAKYRGPGGLPQTTLPC